VERSKRKCSFHALGGLPVAVCCVPVHARSNVSPDAALAADDITHSASTKAFAIMVLPFC
jgi:hypothetical protein